MGFPMEEKRASQSKTVWGALAMLIAFTLQQFNVASSASEIEVVIGQAVDGIQILLGVGGFVMTIYGRYKATHPIK